MSKELKNIAENVMNQIHQDKIKMRPKIYFIIGSIFTFIGLVASILTSIFLVGLMRFSLRAHGPMKEYRLEQILSSFPWWAPAVAILGLIVGIWLISRYDFSYKINFKIIIIGFIVAILTTGWIIDVIGLNDILARKGPMKKILTPCFQQNNIETTFGCHKLRK